MTGSVKRTGDEVARLNDKRRPARTLGVLATLSLIFGILGMGEIFEDTLRVARNSVFPADASGQVVLIDIGERDQTELGSWPWKRSVQAELIDRLSQAGAKHIALDLSYDFRTEPKEDQAFADALKRSGKVILPVRVRQGDGGGVQVTHMPIDLIGRHATIGTISVRYNYQMAVWRTALALPAKDRIYPTYAALLTDTPADAKQWFPIDYRYRMNSFPRLAASDIISGRANLDIVKDKSVIVGITGATIGDQYNIPGRGRYGGVFTHLYASETLLDGMPVDFGWIPALLAALLIVSATLRLQRSTYQTLYLTGSGVLLLVIPAMSERLHIFIDITPALFLLISTGSVLAWRRYRAGGLVNAATGLPNLAALKARSSSCDRALIVARVLNYAQLAATLNATHERALVEQVVSRLGVGSSKTPIYQGDEGIFAWLAEPGIAVGHHVEALHALFRSPARIGGTAYDIAISFGVEIGSGRSIGNRLGSALVAADEAASEGLKWKYHDPERFKDENWRLSLLAQLDQAIDRGEVWVAYQPQLELATGRIRGAEALARWTHPEKGPISPHEFISAAEQHGRIDRLTLFMLEQAIKSAAQINRSGHDFNMSVNLSARTLSRRTLPDEVREMLTEYRLDASRLTLELTETAALANDGSDLDPLLRLRDLGVAISIDDYGTGLSTLDYLKKVPAREIKIDQGFIKSMNDTRSDLVMVKSTIALAHSLGRVVVAEGVENRETLDALIGLNCDYAQGYLIGRPTSYDGLLRRLSLDAKGRAA